MTILSSRHFFRQQQTSALITDIHNWICMVEYHKKQIKRSKKQ